MGSLHLDDLSIRGFRGIRDLHISNLGRVTLITGRNNTGKSSILEALLLYAHHASRSCVIDLLNAREEYRRWDYEEGYPSELESVLLISPLFCGFPQVPENFKPIIVSATGKSGPTKLTLSVNWASHEPDSEGRLRLVPRQLPPDGDSDGVVGFFVETKGHRRPHQLESFLWGSRLTRRLLSELGTARTRTPCILVGPYSDDTTSELGFLWDEIALTDDEQEVVKALRIIDSSISAVSMVGSETNRMTRRAVVRAGNIPHPVSLRTFGDGVNRLFGMALALVNARGGILLIDEFENGLHHSVQTDVWRMIFRLAERLDVQVFATTHSRDSVRSFQEAAAESTEEGVLLRLTRKGDDIVPTVANEEELAVATRHDIEVR